MALISIRIIQKEPLKWVGAYPVKESGLQQLVTVIYCAVFCNSFLFVDRSRMQPQAATYIWGSSALLNRISPFAYERYLTAAANSHISEATNVYIMHIPKFLSSLTI
jgi:hypothetical protein